MARRRYVDWDGLRGLIETSLKHSGFGSDVRVVDKVRYVSAGINHDSYIFAVEGEKLPADLQESGGVLRMPLGQGESFRRRRKDDTDDRSESEAQASIKREVQTLKILEQLPLPVLTPRVICQLQGCCGFIETFLPGVSLDVLKGSVHAESALEIIGRTAAAVHQLPVASFGHLQGCADSTAHILACLKEAVTEDVLELYPPALMAHNWIEGRPPLDRPAVVLHGDLLPQNFVTEPGNDSSAGLVDWEYARIGDPAYDLAIVTRGKRKVLGIDRALKKLVRAYNAVDGGIKLTEEDVWVHELILLMGWLSSSHVKREPGMESPQQYARRIMSLLKRLGVSECEPSEDVIEPVTADGLKVVKIYTDGSADPNPGCGGYGVVLLYDDRRKELQGGYRRTTNNRMEILAAIRGLEALTQRCNVTICTDSQYLRNAMTEGWAQRWRDNGWQRTRSDKAKNADLWSRLLDLCDRHEVRFKWIPGHCGQKENERCDELARVSRQSAGLPMDVGYEADFLGQHPK